MKNYDEVAESVFRRSKEVIKQNNKRRRTLIAIGSAASCLVIAGAVGFGVWRNSVHGADMALSGGQFANDGVNHSAGDDDVDDIIGVISYLDPPEYPTLDNEKNHGGGSDTIDGIGANSSTDPTSGDITDSSGVFNNDTPSSANDPGYATSYSEPVSDTDIEESRMIWPVGGPDGGIIIEVPYWDGGYEGHKGVDIAAEAGTSVYAAADGVVIEAADLYDSRGNFIVIQNDDGYQTHYYHLGELFARVDQRVAAGDIIAEVGATGMATAPFLHFEVRLDDTAVDPIELLPQHDRLMSWNQCDGVPLAK